MTSTSAELCSLTCKPCEGGVDPIAPADAAAQVAALQGWELVDDGKAIEKRWTLKNFVACVARVQEVCDIAEADAHHPDLHIESYRNLRIRLWTHAIGGLSENDFIVAAKIDAIDV